MDKDFYEILGITDDEKSLTGKDFEDVLKKKYKKLAIKWHPDKFATKSEEEKKEAEEKFKSISEAYDTLSDQQKRQEYDMQGNPFAGGNPFEGFDPFSFFSGGMHRQQTQRRGHDVEVNATVSIRDFFNGKDIDITYERPIPCHCCNGTGSKDGKEHKCHYCNGTGMETKTTRIGNMTTMQTSPCSHCHGTGKEASEPCTACHGTGREKVKVTRTVSIPAGTFPNRNAAIKIPGEGEVANGMIPGDLIVRFNLDPNDSLYMTEEGDVVQEVKVPAFDAMLGCDVEVEMLNGDKKKIKLPEMTEDGHEIVFQDKGFPFRAAFYSGYTSFIVKVKYEYPKRLSSKQRELIKKLQKCQ